MQIAIQPAKSGFRQEPMKHRADGKSLEVSSPSARSLAGKHKLSSLDVQENLRTRTVYAIQTDKAVTSGEERGRGEGTLLFVCLVRMLVGPRRVRMECAYKVALRNHFT